MRKTLGFALFFVATTMCTTAQDIQLPEPQKTGGKPLMEALVARQSNREFSAKEIDNQTLSNLLWATYGYNRAEKRTAPSANNKQEYSVYVALQSGAYLYDAKTNALKLVVKQDLRKVTGKQDFVETAPLNIIFAYDTTLMADPKIAYLDCGYLSQNVYLFAASAGLNTVARAFIPYEELTAALKLEGNQKIVLAQTVGYPKE